MKHCEGEGGAAAISESGGEHGAWDAGDMKCEEGWKPESPAAGQPSLGMSVVGPPDEDPWL